MNLDTALANVQRSVPECVATGLAADTGDRSQGSNASITEARGALAAVEAAA